MMSITQTDRLALLEKQSLFIVKIIPNAPNGLTRISRVIGLNLGQYNGYTE
jgi:hypothetical protein